MDKPQDEDHVSADLVNEAKLSDEDLTDSRVTHFGHEPPAMRELL